MSKSSTENWATAVADAGLAREEATVERERTAQKAQTHLERSIALEGRVYVDRAEGAIRSAAQTFNNRIGRPLLDVHRSASGAVSIRSRHDGAFVLLAPTFDADDAGVTASVKQFGRERTTPYRFVLHNDRLHLDCDGAVVNAEQFVRIQLEPWLRDLPLGGR